MPGVQLLNACVDCQVAEASIDARKRWLCRSAPYSVQIRPLLDADGYSDCFIKYIASKPIKRIESYRLRSEAPQRPRKLLLPVSGGVSSVVLLQILDRQLERQVSKRGQTNYELLILTVETPCLDSTQCVPASLHDLRQTFPSRAFSAVPLSEVFELDRDVFGDLSALGAQRAETPAASLESLLSCARTASSWADVLQLLLTRLVVAVAKLNTCDAILWGHSDSRLAAKGLSSVAKGRGGYLPFDIADGPSPWGVTFYYPLRDLFKSELITYANAQNHVFSKLVTPESAAAAAPTPTRATSIDDLLSNYIATQGEKYPSIMANVVRTAGKLQAPVVQPTQMPSRCSICALPMPETVMASGNIGNPTICHACQRLTSETRTDRDAGKIQIFDTISYS